MTEDYDINDLSKWNTIIEPTIIQGEQFGGFYIGDIDCAQDQYLLNKLQIRAILSVVDQPDIILPPNFNHYKISIPDCQEQNLLTYFPKCQNFIDQNRKRTNVMVHCYAGISRSATIVIAYLMHHFNWKYEKAYQISKALRKQLKPNEGFIRQLKQYEIELFIPAKRTQQTIFLKEIESEIEERQQKLIELKNQYKEIQITKNSVKRTHSIRIS